MAEASDIDRVRRAADLSVEDETYDEDTLSGFIDSVGVTSTIALIWEEKAASLSSLADVSEAGASHKFSDLPKNAQSMATYWSKKAAAEGVETSVAGRVRVKKIERS